MPSLIPAPHFQLLATDPSSRARAGILHTRRGTIQTPVFMPVGTQGSVKTVSPDELTALQTQVILGNTYHLHVRPGEKLIARLGGLHSFCNWQKPILTDSGGFQVFSLAKIRKILPEGVIFQNHVDGSPTFLSPETSMQIQHDLGSDIVMAFDECPPYPCSYEEAARSLDLTLNWERRSLAWWQNLTPTTNTPPPLLFAIVQGSTYPALRERSARELTALPFHGYAIGGVSVGEPEPEMFAAVEATEPFLPTHLPRYTMGLGTPPQMLELIARGVDMFDCVLPTRLARNGTAFTHSGTICLKNARFADDPLPIEPHCPCPACRSFSRAYIRHLIKAGEILGLRLITLHNLHFYIHLLRNARSAILNGSFPQFKAQFLATYQTRSKPSTPHLPYPPTTHPPIPDLPRPLKATASPAAQQ